MKECCKNCSDLCIHVDNSYMCGTNYFRDIGNTEKRLINDIEKCICELFSRRLKEGIMKSITCGKCSQYIGAEDNGTYYIIADINGEWKEIESNKIPEEAKCVQCGSKIKEVIKEYVKNETK